MHCSAVSSQVKAEFTETCPLAAWCPAIFSFQTGMDATPLNLGVWAVTVPLVVFQCRLQQSWFLQWHSSVGQFQLSFCSGVPVHPPSIRWVTQWYLSVHWIIQWHFSGIPVYTGRARVHWLMVRVSSHAVAKSSLAWAQISEMGSGVDAIVNCALRISGKILYILPDLSLVTDVLHCCLCQSLCHCSSMERRNRMM